MATIFICYRRQDSRGDAGRLYDRLVGEFGKDEVFFDTSSIRPGTSWSAEIEDELATCKVLLAVIGPNWQGVISDSSDDIVVKELATALQKGNLVIPVLVGGANPPDPKTLPEEVKQLSDRQAFPLNEMSNEAYDADVSRLISNIQNAITEPVTGANDLEHGPAYFTRRIILLVDPEELKEGRIPSSTEVIPAGNDLELFGLVSKRSDGRAWTWGEFQEGLQSQVCGNSDWTEELSKNVIRASELRPLPPSQNCIEGYDHKLYLPVINSTKLCEDGRVEVEILFVNLSDLRTGETS